MKLWRWICSCSSRNFVLTGVGMLLAFAIGAQTPEFRAIGIAEGMPSDAVNDVLMASNGLMWFATNQGLASFDGNNVVAYTAQPDKQDGLQNASLDRLIEDAEGMIWVTTDNGLARFNPKTEAFATFHFAADVPANVRKANRLRPITIDGKGRIWVGSEYGVRVFDPVSEQQIACFLNEGREGFLREDVYSLFTDSHGNVWVGGIGLRVFNSEMEEIDRYKPFPDRNSSYNLFRAFYEAPDGAVWATGDFGLIRWFGSEEPMVISDAEGVPNRFLWSFAPDENNRFWMANYGVGVVVFDPADRSFTTFEPNTNDPLSLPVRFITTTYRDRYGGLWVGTEGAGVLYSNAGNFRYRKWQMHPHDQRDGINAVSCLQRKGLNSWYVGSPHGVGLLTNPAQVNETFFWLDSTWSTIGLAMYDSQLVAASFGHGLRFYDLDGNLNSTTTVLGDYVVSNAYRLLAHRNTLWVGTMGEGLSVQASGSTLVRNYFPRDTMASYLASSVTTLYADGENRVWANVPREGSFAFGADGNLLMTLDQQQQDFVSSNTVNCVLQDHRGNLWLGHNGAGLDNIDVTAQTGTNYTRNNGLPGNVLTALLQDSQQRIWAATERGMSVWLPTEDRFRNVSALLGLEGGTRIEELHLAGNGDVLAVCTDRVLRFNPEMLVAPQQAPRLLIKEITANGSLIDLNQITAASPVDVSLQSSSSSWEVNVAMLEYDYPEHARAWWRLEPFHTEWQPVPEHGKLFVPNLGDGDYKLVLKSGFSWGDEAVLESSIMLHVPVPWWRTFWAIGLYIIVGLVAVWMFVRLRTRVLRQQTKRLEALVQQRTRELEKDKQIIEQQAQQLRELDVLKNRFFANISHELRTPLTLILGPLESFFADSGLSAQQQRFFGIIKENGRKLMSLVEEILDLSKLDASQLKLRAQPVNLHATINRLLFSFESVAYRRQLELSLEYDLPQSDWYELDPDRLEKILTNLLGNAVKFTQQGSVRVRVGKAATLPTTVKHGDYIEIRVTDTGPGIHPEDLPHIFDRYFQSKQADAATQGGTGIGLALSRELARLHKGALLVDSTLGAGSTFTLLLPMNTCAPPVAQPEEMVETATAEEVEPLKASSNQRILVVEDHPEMSAYIKELLADRYDVALVNNGNEALEYLSTNSVDLITSDVMMPGMDGFELLEHLKSTPALSRLPVLMLTARANEQDKLHALRLGVDDYLIKPFAAPELKARIENLLANRLSRAEAQPVDAAIDHAADADQKFVQRLRQIALEHLQESDYTIAMLAPELGVSERQLFREIKRITGLTPGKLLRELRLQEARSLLETKKLGTVAEVCYAVGFEKPGYFSKVYNDRFGKMPSEYLR